MCVKPDYSGVFSGYRYELVENFKITVSALLQCTRGCDHTPIIAVTRYEEKLFVDGFGIGAEDTFKWIQFNESCNSQDLTVYNHSDRKNSSSNITIYGSINKIKKLTTQATINGQMEKVFLSSQFGII